MGDIIAIPRGEVTPADRAAGELQKALDVEAMQAVQGKVKGGLEANGAAVAWICGAAVRARVAMKGAVGWAEGKQVAQGAMVLDEILEALVLVGKVEDDALGQDSLLDSLAVDEREAGRQCDDVPQVLPERHVGMIWELDGRGAGEGVQLEHISWVVRPFK